MGIAHFSVAVNVQHKAVLISYFHSGILL